jgi:hypothetical protein
VSARILPQTAVQIAGFNAEWKKTVCKLQNSAQKGRNRIENRQDSAQNRKKQAENARIQFILQLSG